MYASGGLREHKETDLRISRNGSKGAGLYRWQPFGLESPKPESNLQ